MRNPKRSKRFKTYFVWFDQKHYGPLTIDELQKLGIRRNTLVWNPLLPDWMPACEVPALRPLFTVAEASPVSIPMQIPGPNS